MNINIETYHELEALYQNAVEKKIKVFTFQNQQVLTNYAKYILEHTRNVLKIKDTK